MRVQRVEKSTACRFVLSEVIYVNKQKIIKWLKAAGVRALKTSAQTAVAMIPVGVTVQEVGWGAVAGTAVLAGVTSILTSLAGLPEIKE